MQKNNFNIDLEVNSTLVSLRQIHFKWSFLLMLIGAFFLIGTFTTSCTKKKTELATAQKKDVYYTCSMHPQIHEDHPGDCPICNMKLISVSKANKNAGNAMQIQLSPEQIKLGNIHTDSIGQNNVSNTMVLTGTLNFNQDKLYSLSARVDGRIDRLYFKNIGDYVAKGEKIYSIYSEKLNNAKQEYLNAIQQKQTLGNSLINYDSVIESSKTKLLLWGMSEAQVKILANSKQTSTQTMFYSTDAGYITTINVNEGGFVMEGQPVLQLANLSTLWAEAQVYTTQMSSISLNQNVTVQIPDLNETVNGTIDFINPEIDPNSRINLVRVTIPNIKNQLHPGMSAYITVSNKARKAFMLPQEAVLRDSKGATVWVKIKDGVYEIRMVKIGVAQNNVIEIISGLTAADVVVTSGAYLLNSEYIFQHGADPMAGMKM
ncbi:efflux RND transporter periplasmic adaptor subunit [Halpernia sp. GG3]